MKADQRRAVDGSTRRATLALALVLLSACGDPAGTGGTAMLILRPSFAPGTSLAALSLVIDNVHVVVIRPATEALLADRTAPFSVEAQEVRLSVPVALTQPSETLSVVLELRAGTQVLFSGQQDVAVQAGSAGGSAPANIPLGYSGPGANIAALIISPRDTSVTSGDSLAFAVSAIDSNQAPVASFYVGWSTSDTTLARINAAGLLRTPATAPVRTGVSVRALTPTGIADSVFVTFQAPLPAQISGIVRDALTGGAVPGASVQIKAGGNAGSGDPTLQTVLTNANGGYVLTGVAPGTYTLFVQATGFLTARIAGITLASAEVRIIDVALSPPQQTGQTRIILSWDSLPPDLDAYLVVPPDTGSTPFVVYYGLTGDSLLYPFATLDQDVTSGYGPETITIHQQRAGTYQFLVHDFTTGSDSTSFALAGSRARVEVYQNNQLVQSFTVPNQPGTLWTVFELTGATITTRNVITNDPPPFGGGAAAAAAAGATPAQKGARR